MNNIIDWANKPFAAYPDKTERLVYLLIFLFPIAGMSVRHWITNIFNLLILISLFTLRKPREPLLKEEKVFLWVCAAYFFMFLISAFANDWDRTQTRYLGSEIRFLLAIPLYILIRRYSDCSIWLLRGAVFGGLCLIWQIYYDLYILENLFVFGVYSKNLTGPFAILLLYWLLFFIWKYYDEISKPALFVIVISIIAALATAGLSGSRGSYIGFIITGFASVMFFSKPRWMVVSLVSLCLIAFMSYKIVPKVQHGVDLATNSIQQYISSKDHAKDSSSTSSTGVRLEMFRTSSLIINDNPIVGIGSGNYNKVIQKYVDEGLASPALTVYAHPHNLLLEVATAKGLLGLVVILLLLYYPAYIFIRDYKNKKATAVLGLIQITAISAFSITDHSIVLMNNYSSILLLAIIIFYSSHQHYYKN